MRQAQWRVSRSCRRCSKFFGQRVRVKANLERVCDTIQPIGIRKIPEAVLLDDLRCDGSGHAGCQSQCRLYWKEAWLRPSSAAGEPRASMTAEPGYEELERLSRANTRPASSTPAEPTFRCQATELQRESLPVSRQDVRSLLRQLTSGNVGLARFVRVMLRATSIYIGQRLRLVSRFPFMPQNPPGYRFEAPEPRGLEPGELVRVRSKEEIAKTLDKRSKNRGLWFDREMLPYCGMTTRVQAKVERFVNEKTGRLVELGSDCYIIEGALCTSEHSDGRWFCPRAIHSWWRECWLEPLDEIGDPSHT